MSKVYLGRSRRKIFKRHARWLRRLGREASPTQRPGVGHNPALGAVRWRKASGAFWAEMGRLRQAKGRRLTSEIERTASSSVRSCQPVSSSLRLASIASCWAGLIAHSDMRRGGPVEQEQAHEETPPIREHTTNAAKEHALR